MSSKIITINPNFNIKIVKLGLEKTPIIIIDDFALDLDEIKENACNKAQFAPRNNSYYPGIQAKLPREYAITALQAIYKQLYSIYDIPRHLILKPQDLFYGLITTQEKDLSVPQQSPHFDTPRPFFFAAIHYLNDSTHGGTGMFHHKPTGFERINEQKIKQYFMSIDSNVDVTKKSPSQYIKNSNEQYELLDCIDYKANRLVLYPSNLLHSGIIAPETDISSCPKTGRLTANFFIEFT